MNSNDNEIKINIGNSNSKSNKCFQHVQRKLLLLSLSLTLVGTITTFDGVHVYAFQQQQHVPSHQHQHQHHHPTTNPILTTSPLFRSPSSSSASSSFSSSITTRPSRLTTRTPSSTSTTTSLKAVEILGTLDTFCKSFPYAAAAIVCGLKASLADLFAQTKELTSEEAEDSAKTKKKNKNESLSKKLFLFQNADWKRNLSFILYGSMYQGMTQEFIYNHLYPIWFGVGTGWTTVLTKVAFTLGIQTTLLTLPTLYISKAIMEKFSVKEAMQQYLYDLRHQQLLQKFYVFWGPVLCLTFSVIPEHLRVPSIAVFSFFWLIILSRISGGK